MNVQCLSDVCDVLTFKFRGSKTVQNCLVWHLKDQNIQQKRRLLCEKLQDERDTQKKRNTSPRMRSVAARIFTAQLKG